MKRRERRREKKRKKREAKQERKKKERKRGRERTFGIDSNVRSLFAINNRKRQRRSLEDRFIAL